MALDKKSQDHQSDYSSFYWGGGGMYVYTKFHGKPSI